jgi:hypothetical protein
MKNPNSSRRNFIGQLAPVGLAILAGGMAVPAASRNQTFGKEKLTDEQICRRKFTLATKESLHERPMGEVMVAVGASFLGTPYVAGTLETPGDERLVVNLHGLDCVTFVENTLALSRCINMGVDTFEEFKEQLKFIRYRGGMLNGYPSRLHYFSDWIDDNETKNVVRNISQEIGGVLYEKNLTFMSTHPDSYKQLSNQRYLEKITAIESDINLRQHYYIPKEQLKNIEQKIEPGDIIGITTSTEGLDIAHVGMGIRTNGALKYLHAPLSKGKIQISEQPLVEYLTSHAKQTGIMVARALAQAS